MRTILFLSICFSIKAVAQPNDQLLKLSITLGDGLQMAFDPVDRQHNFNTEIDAKLSNGDLQFYRGHYRRSVGYYHEILEDMVKLEDTGPIDVFKLSKWQDKRFTKSEKFLRQVGKKPIPEDAYDDLTHAINNLGIYHHHIGNYPVAEKLFLKALSIRGEVFGKTSLAYVTTLHNLAVLRKDQGRYDAASDMLSYVLRFIEKRYSKNSLLYVISANNHAMLLSSLGQAKEALALLQMIEAQPEVFPDHSLDYARILVNSGLLYLESGRLEEATGQLKKAIDIYELKGASKHPDYWKIQLDLARVNLRLNNTAFLDEYIEKNLEELEKDLGASSLTYLDALELKADYLMALKDHAQSVLEYQKVVEGRKSRLGVLHKNYLSVSTKLAMAHWKNGQNVLARQQLSATMNRYLKVVESYFYSMTEHEKARFWSVLNPDLNAYYAFISANHNQFPEILDEAYNLRLQTKGLLLHNTNQIRRSLQSSLDEDLKKKYQEWIVLKETLASYYGLTMEDVKELGVGIKDLEQKANTLEKEINRSVTLSSTINVSANLSAIQDKLGDEEAAVEIIRVSDNESSTYMALVTKKEEVSFVPIGNAEELEKKMTPYYHNVIRTKTKESLSYKKFWIPFADQLAGYARIYLSLDGAYNLINLNALQSEGEYIIDLLDIVLVPNTSSIVGNPNLERNPNAVLIGNPNFDGSAVPLPGTREEIEAINKILQMETQVLMDEAASESALKKIKQPIILHIATHGFFEEDTKSKSGQRSLTLDNPLFRSGLLLSKPKNTDGMNKGDGLFTSYDAMNLDLQNTDLVVLSACETGKGEVINGEGVYGLSRAFTIAGARNLIMSLWKVDDQATKELMISLYRFWQSGVSLKDAFRQAQQEMKKKYEDPYYWAAFVLITNE
ncbi:MAG: CHAT domain-containing tetratricopeptide repeat protein [Ekhidna sp.]